MFDTTTLKEIETAAREIGIETAALAAVAHIESGLRTHAMIGGRVEPLIRFEGHYFDRRLTGTKRDRARAEGLASPTAGAIANPASQASRWKLLERAAAIDRAAAYESVSWGIGQVMGAHWAWLGFATVEALVAQARSGVGGQLRLMTRYIVKAGLADALRNRDWASFARGYNGPGYRRNEYDTKLARAYARYEKMQEPAQKTALLRRGARGKDVVFVQTALAERGIVLAIDGIFGAQTERAVRDYQRDKGLVVDGIVGQATRAALSDERWVPSMPGWITRVFRRLRTGRKRLTHKASTR
ncbi:N-acetylmuramidase domain-containing protein [Mesorhizobium sp. CAU 1732]|uniref:N-acetylmuramidase domain-containing protein n=1 Tax=Mesorhizobium sp. CAU 1732 TaxID=3140358 RepID=UPI0032600B78